MTKGGSDGKSKENCKEGCEESSFQEEVIDYGVEPQGGPLSYPPPLEEVMVMKLRGDAFDRYLAEGLALSLIRIVQEPGEEKPTMTVTPKGFEYYRRSNPSMDPVAAIIHVYIETMLQQHSYDQTH